MSSPSLQILLKNSPNALEFSLVSALKSISSSRLMISHGEQLHCFILKSGLYSNLFIQNSLMSMYSKTGMFLCAKSIFENSQKLNCVSCNIMLHGNIKHGRLEDAYKLFAKMPVRDSESYKTMIIGLSKNDCYGDAIGLFREMRLLGMVPEQLTMASVMPAYARLYGDKTSAKLLHGLVLKLGLDKNDFVSTNLVLLYCISSSLDDAQIVFDKMVDKDVVSWNVMLNGNVKAGLIDLARKLFDKMVDRDVVTWILMLNGYVQAGLIDMARKLFDKMVDKDVVICTVMLNGYVKAGLIDLAREFFEGIPQKNVVSWSTMIHGYVQLGRLSEALALYCEMRHIGLSPSVVMITDVISACGQATKFIEGQQFHALALKMGINSYESMQETLVHFYGHCREIKLAYLQFEEGNKDHVACWNALIVGLMKNGMVNDAAHLFGIMPERVIVSWNSMISGYLQNEKHHLAIKLFHEMIAKGIKPDEVTMTSVFSTISSLGTLEEGRWAHNYIFRNSIPIDDNLSAAIILMYAKCGNINYALKVFRQIQEKATSVAPWNAIICGLAMHGHAEVSLRIFTNLQSRAINPDSITFTGVLSACSHAGLVEAGERHFEIMKTVYGLEPDIEQYGCMVDMLGRAGRLEEAEELVKRMPMKADVVIWGTLLAACKIYGNTDVGERAALNLAKVEPSDGSSRVLLSNLYKDAGRWDDAFLVRRAMRSGKLKRSPGYSVVV